MFESKTNTRSQYSIPLILLGFMTMFISLMLVFNPPKIGGIFVGLTGFGIGGALLITGLLLNSKLNKMKAEDEKFALQLEEIHQLPLEERQKEIKKTSLKLSASLFLNAGLMGLMLQISTNKLDSEFLFNNYFPYTLLIATGLFAISGFYALKFKKLGAIFAIIASLFQGASMILYLISIEESNNLVFYLNFGTGWVVANIWAAYKYLK